MIILGLEPEGLNPPLFLHSIDGHVQVAYICKMFKVSVGGESLKADLDVLPMSLYDVILGMDFLTNYRVSIDYYRRRVALVTRSGSVLVYQGDTV